MKNYNFYLEIRIPRRRGRQRSGGHQQTIFAKFSKKMHEIEKILGLRWAPPRSVLFGNYIFVFHYISRTNHDNGGFLGAANAPSPRPNVFIFVRFWDKICQIIGCCPRLGVGLRPSSKSWNRHWLTTIHQDRFRQSKLNDRRLFAKTIKDYFFAKRQIWQTIYRTNVYLVIALDSKEA